MWARMPIQALVADIPLDEWPEPMEDHLCQPWDCESRHHSVITMDRVSSSPWMCKINNKFYQGKYLFTVDYTDHEIADDPAQHKQSHVIYLTDAGKWTGNIVALLTIELEQLARLCGELAKEHLILLLHSIYILLKVMKVI